MPSPSRRRWSCSACDFDQRACRVGRPVGLDLQLRQRLLDDDLATDRVDDADVARDAAAETRFTSIAGALQGKCGERSPQHPHHLLRAPSAKLQQRYRRQERDVRRDDDVRSATPAPAAARLALDDIERGAGKHAAIERAEQRVVIHEASPADVDEQRLSPAAGEERIVDQVAGRLEEREMQDDDVGLGAQAHRATRSPHRPAARCGDGSAAMTRQPKPASLRAVARPMRPSPTSPTVSARRRPTFAPPGCQRRI